MQWELPVAGSHWPSGTTDLDGQLTENSEEPRFLRVFSGSVGAEGEFHGDAVHMGIPCRLES
jgi:hypothetical protein